MYQNLREARKKISPKQFRRLQEKVVSAASQLQSAEVYFIQVLQEVEDHMLHRWCGYNSLFTYAVECLRLSSSQAYMYCALAKSTRKLPTLSKALKEGVVTPSKASRVLAVINEKNEQEWVQKASLLPKRQLEKEVVKLNPKRARGECSVYLTPDVIEMKIPVSEGVYHQIVRVQDLLSQSEGVAVSMEQVFEKLTTEYIKRNDPVEKEKRYQGRIEKENQNQAEEAKEKGKRITLRKNKIVEKCHKYEGNGVFEKVENIEHIKMETCESRNTFSARRDNIELTKIETSKDGIASSAGIDKFAIKRNSLNLRKRGRLRHRQPLPSEAVHQVYLRDQGECQHEYPSGEKCRSRRWLHLHHKIPVSKGGDHRIHNLTTLCSDHHKLTHVLMEKVERGTSCSKDRRSTFVVLPGQNRL